jgi:putative aldouronate transport system permease protein
MRAAVYFNGGVEVAKKTLTISKIIINALMTVLSICFVIPIIYILSISFSNEAEVVKYGYKLIPKSFTTSAYNYIFNNPKIIIDAYMVTIFVTVIGTLLSLLITAMLSYGISRKDYRYRKITSFLIYFTMLFNGGLVPWYILISHYLHLKDNIFVMIIPYLVNAWFVLLMKGFLQSLPVELFESAKVDGAKEFRIFFQIVLPLSKPGLATVGLFMALMYWNDWWLAMLFIDNNSIIPIQFMLNRILSTISFLTSGLSKNVNIDVSKFPTESARMAMCILAAGPMLFAFPFFQKYFVKGLTVGSIKG